MRHIRRLPDSVGIVNDELPWDGMKMAAHIDALENRATAMRDVRKQQDEEIYKREASYFYDDLCCLGESARRSCFRPSDHPGPQSQEDC